MEIEQNWTEKKVRILNLKIEIKNRERFEIFIFITKIYPNQ